MVCVHWMWSCFRPPFFWPRTHNFLFCFVFFLHVYCRCVWFEFLRFQFGIPPLKEPCQSYLHRLRHGPTSWKCDTLVWKQCLIQQWHPDPNEVLLTQRVQSRATFIKSATLDPTLWPLNYTSVLSDCWQVSERLNVMYGTYTDAQICTCIFTWKQTSLQILTLDFKETDL